MVQHCPRCGAKNIAREPLCGRCGQKLYGLFVPGAPRSACGTCVAPNPGTAEFCVRCGRPIDDVPGAPERPSVEPPPRIGALAGEKLTVAPPGGAAARRSRPPVVAQYTPPQPRHSSLPGVGCLAGLAAALVAVLGAALLFSFGPRGVSLSLPTTWRAASTAGVVVLDERAEALGRDGLAVAGSSSRAPGASSGAGFALPLATPEPPARASRGAGLASGAASPSAGPGLAVPRGSAQYADVTFDRPPTPAEPASSAPAPLRLAAAATPAVRVSVGEPARRGVLVFKVASLDVRPALGRRRIDLSVALQNVGGTALPYDAAMARLESSSGESHLPITSIDRPLAYGLIGSNDGLVVDLSFDVPADSSRLTLAYDGIAVDLGEASPARAP